MVEGNVVMPVVRVAILDAFGNRLPTGVVSMALGASPWPNATLAGTLNRSVVNGVATFNNLRVDRPGAGYSLEATLGVLAARSRPFTAKLTFTSVSAGRSLSASGDHTCGVTSGNALYCWGANGQGQLGAATGLARLDSVPLLVSVTLSFASVSAGEEYTCGVTTAGAAYCWGDNQYGQLGDGTTTDRSTPVLVSGGLSFTSVSAGLNHTCAVSTGGAAYCWGKNALGQLGDGSATDRLLPVSVSGGLAFDSVSAGGDHTCGVTTGGVAYCWGLNASGQLGDGTVPPANSAIPTPVSGGLSFALVHAGFDHTCGVTTGPGGDAYCWGQNTFGQLGDGTALTKTSPVPVSGALSFVSVSTGGWHTCGVTAGAELFCWGRNLDGQFGTGTTDNGRTPTNVAAGWIPLATGGAHTCGLNTSLVGVYCSGSNVGGQLGIGQLVIHRSVLPLRVVQ
ncbi:MAG: RCC1 domain-containing protein [Gemmatimonadales bacterium]